MKHSFKSKGKSFSNLAEILAVSERERTNRIKAIVEGEAPDARVSPEDFLWVIRSKSLSSEEARTTVAALIRHGLSPNDLAKDSWGTTTPLIEVIRSGDKSLMKLLLDMGANPDGVMSGEDERKRRLPLNEVLNNDKLNTNDVIEMVSMLLKAGADPNPKTSSGYSPLSNSVFRNDIALVDLLMDAGADPWRKEELTYGDLLPEEFAIKRGRPEMGEHIKNRRLIEAARKEAEYLSKECKEASPRASRRL